MNSSMNFKELLQNSWSTRTVNELRNLTQYNMFNLHNTMWMDLNTMVFSFDSMRPDWIWE